MQTILVSTESDGAFDRLFGDLMKMLDLPPSALELAPVSAERVHAGTTVPGAITLGDLPIGGFATIEAVMPGKDEVDRHLVLRLIEIGFVPGERVRVVAVGRPGNEPLAVRLTAADSGRRNTNGSTFALRRHEAGFVRVIPDLAGD